MLESQPQAPKGDATTGEDLTIRPGDSATEREQVGATEEQYVPVGGPRSGDQRQGGTQDEGVNPDDEITPG